MEEVGDGEVLGRGLVLRGFVERGEGGVEGQKDGETGVRNGMIGRDQMVGFGGDVVGVIEEGDTGI